VRTVPLVSSAMAQATVQMQLFGRTVRSPTSLLELFV